MSKITCQFLIEQRPVIHTDATSPSKKREMPKPDPSGLRNRILIEAPESPKSLKNRKLSFTPPSPCKEPFPVFEGFIPTDFTGYATLRNEDGSVYHGDIKNGVRHGMGQLICKNKTYTAMWKNDHLHGLAQIDFENGGSYIGRWKNGVRENRGLMIYVDGSSYAGDLKSGVRQGYGRYDYPDGTIYQGMWQENKRCGPGVRTLIDGSVLTGQWVDDKCEGKCTLFHPDGKYETVHYLEGKRQSTSLLE